MDHDSTAVAPQDRGATAVEYALIASLIAGVVGGAIALLGQHVVGLFTSVPGF
ncbi:Flp family type IVb pilin [Oryzihumus sp.]|uniref:Flp family type IVb pilin n=1 Tax=Oryzihumus sp. TaxID=1968903 RepID=UPI002ED80C98